MNSPKMRKQQTNPKTQPKGPVDNISDHAWLVF